MPYNKRQDLPDAVQSSLPEEAQKIFMSAYNNAWEEYEDADDRQGKDSREDVARKVAWSAVKSKYKKVQQGEWKKK